MISERTHRSVTHGGVLPSHNAAPLPSRTTVNDVLRLRFPSQARDIPKRCTHCGGAVIVGDIPTAEHPRSDAACLLCARPAAELLHDGFGQPMTPAQWRELPVEGPRGAGRPPKGYGEQSYTMRIARLLGAGTPMHADDLASTLGCQIKVVRNAISHARRLGHQIVCEDGFYRMEATP